jgi:hypothetical protein
LYGATKLVNFNSSSTTESNGLGAVVGQINIPESVNTIGDNAFYNVGTGDSTLTSYTLTLPTNPTYIGTKLFGDNGSAKLNKIIFSNPDPTDAILNYD